MPGASTQTTRGKAYEYACLFALSSVVGKTRPVYIHHNSSLTVARTAWESLDEPLQEKMNLSAHAGIRTLLELEPKITEDGNDELELSLQEDARGQEGDVRDVLIIRRSINWEIGLSVKHNHTAVKHSRLSQTIDFGRDWLGMPCSPEYFQAITPIFTRLRKLRDEGALWSDVLDKTDAVYIPLLQAFMDELRRLDAANPGVVPDRLLTYLLGRKDFYKIISNDQRRTTMLQSFNLQGTLNTASGDRQPTMKVGRVTMPTKIYHMEFQESDAVTSTNKVELVMNNNWVVSLRIHNASSRVEPSLKFDIQLTGVPSAMYSSSASW